MSETAFTAFRMNHPELEPEEATKILVEARKHGVPSLDKLEQVKAERLKREML